MTLWLHSDTKLLNYINHLVSIRIPWSLNWNFFCLIWGNAPSVKEEWNSWANVDVEDRQPECAKDGTVFLKKNMNKNLQNIRKKKRTNKTGQNLEYNPSLGSSHFRVLFLNILWCNHLHGGYRLLGWTTMGHNDDGNRCSWYRFLDGHYQMAITSNQEVES